MTGKELKVRWAVEFGPLGNQLTALVDEAIANDEYDEAVCHGRIGPLSAGLDCQGENHIETCPVLIAWQDRKAASEKRRGMR